MATPAEYDAAKASIRDHILEAEKHLPFFAQRLISQAPAEQVDQFEAMLAKGAVDAAEKVREKDKQP
jgi:hypothetical protein